MPHLIANVNQLVSRPVAADLEPSYALVVNNWQVEASRVMTGQNRRNKGRQGRRTNSVDSVQAPASAEGPPGFAASSWQRSVSHQSAAERGP